MWKKLFAALSLLIGGAAQAGEVPDEPVAVVVDDAGRHYAGVPEGGPDVAAFVRLRDPLVLGEDTARRMRLWPMSWAEWVDTLNVRAARYWPAGPELRRTYRAHLERFRREYAVTHGSPTSESARRP